MWVPPRVAAELADQSSQYDAAIAKAVEELRGTLEHWNRQLKDIDPYLELIKAREDAKVPGLRPGYYHVLRHNPGAPVSVEVWDGPEGEFREPDSGLFDRLAEGDMWSERALSVRKRKELSAARDKERAEERKRDDLRVEIGERWVAASRPQVLFSDVKGWTPKAGVRSDR